MADVAILKRSGLKTVPVDGTVDTGSFLSVKLNGTELTQADVQGYDSHLASTANPHGTTKAHILVGNEIVNADVDAAAAILESKLSLDYSTASLYAALAAVESGSTFREYCKVITGDVAPADDAALSTLLPFSDDDDSNVLIGEFAANDFIMFGAEGTPKLMKVWDDAGTLKVTSVSVTQPIEGNTYHVKLNLLGTPDDLEKRAIYGKSATIMIKIADEVWDTAVGILLGAWTPAAGTISSADSVLSAMQKLDGNKIDKTQIKTILTGDEAADVPSVSAVNVGLASKVGAEVELTNAEALELAADKVCYVNGSGANLASYDASLTMLELEFMYMSKAAIASAASGQFAKPNTVFTLAGSIGDVAYLDTAGAITLTEPATGDVIIIGKWVAANEFHFKPRYIITK